MAASTLPVDHAPLPTWARGPLLVLATLATTVAAWPLAAPGVESSPLWVGMLLAARLLAGPGAWPWVLVAAGAAAVLQPMGATWGQDLAMGAVTAGGVLATAAWLEARAGGPAFGERPAHFVHFVVAGCFLLPLVLAVASALIAPGATFWPTVQARGVALAFALALITLLALGVALGGKDCLERMRRHKLEALAIVLVLVGVCWLALARDIQAQPVLIGLTVWVLFRARMTGAIVLATTFALAFEYATAHGFGPFTHPPGQLGLDIFRLRVTMQAVAVLGFGCALAQNARHVAALMAQHEELRALHALQERHAEDLEREVAARTEDARRSRDEAEAASRAKSEFLARMSHEIRTPITALKGFAELLGDPVVDDARRLRYAAIMRRNSEHLGVLIDDILDLTRIEAGKLTVERVACSLPALLEDVELLLDPRARDRGLRFELRLDGAVPVQVETDPTRLRQVLLNLAGNAIKFTERGGVTVEARMAPGDTLVLTVTDTGIGMDLAQQERLFQPFEQGDSSLTRRFGGAGLGLAIVQALVQAMDGRLEVRSAPRAGTTFTLALPVGVPAGTPVTSTLAPHELDLPHEGRLAGRVLMAEDGPDNRLLFDALLRAAGLDLTLVEDGQAALEAVLAAEQALDPYDLVLMDMQMPVLDGYAATRALRERGYGGPIVAVTAHAMAGERERCLAAGCDDFLAKPIERTRLLEVVARHLPAGPTPLDLEGVDFEDLKATFQGTLGERLAAIGAAADALDHAALERLAHQLRGAAGSYDAPAVTHAAEALEQAARASAGPDVLAPLVAALAGACEAARG